MKKLLMILLASMALVACGSGSDQSEANRNAEENAETTAPVVESDEDMRNETSTDSTGTMGVDTTGMSGEDTPSR
jgi:hypothetical protein